MKSINRKATHEHQILEKIEAGVVLTGNEAKTVREGRVDISTAYARLIGGELMLLNANIAIENGDTRRTRKLLVHKRELVALASKIARQKLTLVPLGMYTKGRLVKVQLGLARPRRAWEKRELIKRRDIQRDTEKELRGPKE